MAWSAAAIVVGVQVEATLDSAHGMNPVIAFGIGAFCLLFLRIGFVLKYPPKRKFSPGQTCRLAVFLGSGNS